jgi:uncharacterized protein YndB with AHSA1/START domain
MQSTSKTKITVQTSVNAKVEKAWDLFNSPDHITQWNSATPEWHTPKAENDLREGGKFTYRMEAKDGSFGFDFGGTYNRIEDNRLVSYTLEDGRTVEVSFVDNGGSTEVIEVFEAEETNSEELQRTGWQAILDNFKKYVESVA